MVEGRDSFADKTVALEAQNKAKSYELDYGPLDTISKSHHIEMMKIKDSILLQKEEMCDFYIEKLKFWQESCDFWRQKYLKALS